MSKTNKHRGVSREQWMRAALDMIHKIGVDNVTVDGLAKKLGISRSGFYWHFKNRDDLLKQILKFWTYDNNERTIEQINALEMGPIERLTLVAEAVLDQDLAKYEIGIRHWALQNRAAARAVRNVNKMRLDLVRSNLHTLGFRGDELEMRTMLFVCYTTWETPMFQEIPRDNMRKLISRRIKLLTTK